MVRLAEYQDYRLFLKDWVETKIRLNPALSYRRIAQIFDLKSPNYLQMILTGKRNLTEKTGRQIAEKLKLSSPEIEYFISLIRRDGATTEDERREMEAYRLISLKRMLAKEIPKAQREVFSHWYHFLVRELFLLPDARADGAWISKKLSGLISPEEAEESLKVLLDAGFLREQNISEEDVPQVEDKPVGDNGGLSLQQKKLVVSDPIIETNSKDFQHIFLQKFHADVLKMWSQNLEKLSPAEQELGLLNLPISSKRIPELKVRINQFLDEVLGMVENDKEADCVVQLGTYLMPYK